VTALYHGTRSPFRGRGGLLLPPSKHGGPVNHGATKIGDRDEWVYATTDLDLAWDYAHAAKGRGAPRVLVLQPMGDVQVDDSTVGGQEQEAFRMEAALVLEVLR
jgi:hypothetical protein